MMNVLMQGCLILGIGVGALRIQKSMSSTAVEAPTHHVGQDDFILLQYGKVGSSTLRDSFADYFYGKDAKDFLKSVPFAWKRMSNYPREVMTHEADIAKDKLEHSGSEPWILTVTRNRFHRDISAYFQNVGNWKTKEQVLTMPISELHEDFRTKYHGDVSLPTSDNPHKWFQTEFQKAVGFNIVDHAGDFKDGSLYVERNFSGRLVHTVLIRFEDMQRWDLILGKYFPGFQVGDAKPKNIGDEKWYAARYEEFLNTYKFSESEIDLLCGGDTFKFYTKEEVQAMAPQCDKSLSGSPKPMLKQDSRYLVSNTNTSSLVLHDFFTGRGSGSLTEYNVWS